jgi:hypothetical protein
VLAGRAGGLAAAGLSGCTWLGGGKPAPTAAPHPLEPALTATLALIDRYQATIAAQATLADRLRPLLTDHEADADALRHAMGRPSPSATASAQPSGTAAADPVAALADLRGAEQAAQTGAVTACLAAPAGYAGLLGSIAACRATHLEVLG